MFPMYFSLDVIIVLSAFTSLIISLKCFSFTEHFPRFYLLFGVVGFHMKLFKMVTLIILFFGTSSGLKLVVLRFSHFVLISPLTRVSP